MVKDVAVTDAAGERNLKLIGPTVIVSQNGSNVYMPVFDWQTLYASALVTINAKGYTKHYFEEGNRICSSIGGGRLGLVDEAEPIVAPWDEWQTVLSKGVLETYKQSFGVEPYIGVGDLYVSIDRFSNEENTDEPTFYYHTDHLGSTTLVTDDNADVVQQIAYLPYGEEWVNIRHRFGSSHKFNGKQKDDETGYSYYGARYYTDRLSIWLSVDPLVDKYPHLSPYAYCADNPVMFIDPDGREVKAVFNRETHKLYILDLDYYNKALPTVWVSAKDYQLGGIRDKDGNLTHNQVLVVNNVFSGGLVENGKFLRDADDSRQLAIPNAKYDIVDNNADTRHTGWFRLDRQDDSRYNDKYDVAGRDGYRFHLGGLSWGCVTVDKTQDNAQASWAVVSSILNSTSTTTVSEKRGKQWLNPFSKLTRYGTLEVKGADKIPFKPKEE